MATLLEAVQAYLGDTSDDVAAALAAEKTAQGRRCRIPVEATEADADTWPADLLEALCRRTARNLAARGNPLGFVPGITDTSGGGTFFGSSDPEVRRLEGPFRKLVVG